MTPTLEKSQSLQAELAPPRPQSMVLPHHSDANVIVNPGIVGMRQVSHKQITNPVNTRHTQ